MEISKEHTQISNFLRDCCRLHPKEWYNNSNDINSSAAKVKKQDNECKSQKVKENKNKTEKLVKQEIKIDSSSNNDDIAIDLLQNDTNLKKSEINGVAKCMERLVKNANIYDEMKCIYF